MNKILRIYDSLSNRKGFNDSLSHFQTVMDAIADFEEGYNLADIINALLDSKTLSQGQVASVLYALLADKYAYFSKSANLKITTHDFSYILSQLKKIKAFDIVLSYHHPELGNLVINPKNEESWNVTNELRRNEFITIYVGTFSDDKKEKFSRGKTADLIFDILNGKKPKLPELLLKGSYRYKEYELFDEDEDYDDDDYDDDEEYEEEIESEEAEETEERQAEPKSSGSQKMTPFYSVPVTNELFHNGNVEAWKRIIQSYNVKNPDLEVHIFYDGERILNIASLFKWGKVKHGSSILFAVAGEDIKDVAKLQKYLKQGASPKFEDFLKFPVNTILNLF